PVLLPEIALVELHVDQPDHHSPEKREREADDDSEANSASAPRGPGVDIGGFCPITVSEPPGRLRRFRLISPDPLQFQNLRGISCRSAPGPGPGNRNPAIPGSALIRLRSPFASPAVGRPPPHAVTT